MSAAELDKEAEEVAALLAETAVADQGVGSEEVKIINIESHLADDIYFTDPSFRIPAPVLDALTLDMRLERPFKIQAKTLPYIMSGRNIIAQAQAGAGKTIAFAIGMLSKVNPSVASLQALCLTPTRELAIQILADAIQPLKKHMVPEVITEAALAQIQVARGGRSSAHLVVGTPGKVTEWVNKKYIRLGEVAVFVLDEADTMIGDTEQGRSMGSESIAIRAQLPPACQIMLFSATFPPDIMATANRIVPKPVTFRLASDEELMMEKIFKVTIDARGYPDRKIGVLQELYRKLSLQQSIVFVERKEDADRISGMMRAAGLEVSTLHSTLKGSERDEVMERFRKQQSRVLITTNVLARGVDVPSIGVVINYDLPVVHSPRRELVPDTVTYVHRIGRTGRGERTGTAISLVDSDEDRFLLNAIDSFFSPDKTMMVEWDPADVTGLCEEIARRQTLRLADT